MMEKHPLQIKIPDLQQSEDVEKAVEKKERLEDVDIPNNPNERIEAYMDRLENLFLNSDERVKERNLEMIKPALYDHFLIKPEEVPESYFELQKQIARERGVAVEEIPQEMKEQMIKTLISDQKHSLDQWIEYLTSDDVAYPTWFKYFAFRNITKLSQFDKELGKFKDRTDSTVAPYPDIYRAPLAKMLDIYNEAIKSGKPQNDSEFTKSFPKLYAELISESLAHQIENQEEVKGEWIKYNQGNQRDADKLFDSVQAKGTGWCIEGHSTASNYMKQGDFYVFYTNDTSNEPTQPRVAIQMNGSQIGQVRGILPHQELEPIMAPILEEKLKEFGSEADSYQKKVEDMRKMTEIENKTQSNQELIFLYEIDEKIEGFGYERDPRIGEIRGQRNSRADYATVFECKEEDIVIGNPDDITETTKLYSFEQDNIDYTILPKLKPGMKIYAELPDKPVEFIKPSDLNYEELSKERSVKKARILNPDIVGVDLEKTKCFIPDLSKFNGKPLFEVMQYVEKTYGDKYHLPGLEYQDFIIKNPDKFPQMKDGNYYFFPGSIRYWGGYWRVPCSYWFGDAFDRYGRWLGYDWSSYYRLVLLETQ
jgi:hypothetical protein